jgi:hypothetical protein
MRSAHPRVPRRWFESNTTSSKTVKDFEESRTKSAVKARSELYGVQSEVQKIQKNPAPVSVLRIVIVNGKPLAIARGLIHNPVSRELRFEWRKAHFVRQADYTDTRSAFHRR